MIFDLKKKILIKYCETTDNKQSVFVTNATSVNLRYLRFFLFFPNSLSAFYMLVETKNKEGNNPNFNIT